MLNKDSNTIETEATETVDAVKVPAAARPTGMAIFSSGFSTLDGAFQRELNIPKLPAEATLSCTIYSGALKTATEPGGELSADLGDFLLIRPLNLHRYLKLDLGQQELSEDEKKLQVSCDDGATCFFGEEQFSKDDFTELVKSKGFSKATWKPRAVLHGQYLDCDRAAKVGIEPNSLMAIYLSPSSLKAWEGFLINAAVKRKTGELLKLTKVDAKFGTKSWVKFGFEAVSEDSEDVAA